MLSVPSCLNRNFMRTGIWSVLFTAVSLEPRTVLGIQQGLKNYMLSKLKCIMLSFFHKKAMFQYLLVFGRK